MAYYCVTYGDMTTTGITIPLLKKSLFMKGKISSPRCRKILPVHISSIMGIKTYYGILS
jgi:hypothetical protein